MLGIEPPRPQSRTPSSARTAVTSASRVFTKSTLFVGAPAGTRCNTPAFTKPCARCAASSAIANLAYSRGVSFAVVERSGQPSVVFEASDEPGGHRGSIAGQGDILGEQRCVGEGRIVTRDLGDTPACLHELLEDRRREPIVGEVIDVDRRLCSWRRLPPIQYRRRRSAVTRWRVNRVIPSILTSLHLPRSGDARDVAPLRYAGPDRAMPTHDGRARTSRQRYLRFVQDYKQGLLDDQVDAAKDSRHRKSRRPGSPVSGASTFGGPSMRARGTYYDMVRRQMESHGEQPDVDFEPVRSTI